MFILIAIFCMFLIGNKYEQIISFLIYSKFCSNLATSVSAVSNFNGLVFLYSWGKCWNFHYIDYENQNKQDVFPNYRSIVWVNKTNSIYDIQRWSKIWILISQDVLGYMCRRFFVIYKSVTKKWIIIFCANVLSVKCCFK